MGLLKAKRNGQLVAYRLDKAAVIVGSGENCNIRVARRRPRHAPLPDPQDGERLRSARHVGRRRNVRQRQEGQGASPLRPRPHPGRKERFTFSLSEGRTPPAWRSAWRRPAHGARRRARRGQHRARRRRLLRRPPPARSGNTGRRRRPAARGRRDGRAADPARQQGHPEAPEAHRPHGARHQEDHRPHRRRDGLPDQPEHVRHALHEEGQADRHRRRRLHRAPRRRACT